jgi:hypothetical protein
VQGLQAHFPAATAATQKAEKTVEDLQSIGQWQSGAIRVLGPLIINRRFGDPFVNTIVSDGRTKKIVHEPEFFPCPASLAPLFRSTAAELAEAWTRLKRRNLDEGEAQKQLSITKAFQVLQRGSILPPFMRLYQEVEGFPYLAAEVERDLAGGPPSR